MAIVTLATGALIYGCASAVSADMTSAVGSQNTTSSTNSSSSQVASEKVKISYEFVDTEGNPIPELFTYLPTSYEVSKNTQVEAPELYGNVVKGRSSSWIFQKWEKSEVTASTDTVFRGVWKPISKKIEIYKKDTKKLTYEFVSQDTTRALPREVKDQLPQNEQINIYTEDHKYFDYHAVRDSDGTWSFEGWDIKSYTPTEDEKINDSAIFAQYLKYTGSWVYTPSNTLPRLDIESTKTIAKGTLFDPRTLIRTVDDAEDGALKADDVDIRGIVDVGKKGTYTLTYRLLDSKLAVTEKESRITVGDATVSSARAVVEGSSISTQATHETASTNLARDVGYEKSQRHPSVSSVSSVGKDERSSTPSTLESSEDMVTISYRFKYLREHNNVEVDPHDVPSQLTTFLPQSYRVKKGTNVTPPHMYEGFKAFSYNQRWRFNSWDKASVVANKDIEFVGTWKREPFNVIRPSSNDTFFMTYAFESDNSSQTLPAAVVAHTPQNETVQFLDKPQRPYSLFPKEIRQSTGVWSFKKWAKAQFDLNGSVKVFDDEGNDLEYYDPYNGWYDAEGDTIDWVQEGKRYNKNGDLIGTIDDEGNRYDNDGNLVKKTLLPTSQLKRIVEKIGDTNFSDLYMYVGIWSFTPASPASLNEAPTLTLKNTEITVGDTFDPKSMILSASDTEDGTNLTNDVWAYGVINTQKEGSYPIHFTIRDKKGACVHKTATLTVKAAPTPLPSSSQKPDDTRHEGKPQPDNAQTPQISPQTNVQTQSQNNSGSASTGHSKISRVQKGAFIPQTSDVMSNAGVLSSMLVSIGGLSLGLASKRIKSKH